VTYNASEYIKFEALITFIYSKNDWLKSIIIEFTNIE